MHGSKFCRDDNGISLYPEGRVNVLVAKEAMERSWFKRLQGYGSYICNFEEPSSALTRGSGSH